MNKLYYFFLLYPACIIPLVAIKPETAFLSLLFYYSVWFIGLFVIFREPEKKK